MKPFALIFLAITGLATIACFVPKIVSAAEPTTKPTTEPTAAVNKLCPITKEAVDSSVATYEYKGKKIGFCCSDCVKTFKENPDKYMADLK